MAVLLAVLAGFFLMHGAASGDSCSDGASPVSAGGTTQNVAATAQAGVSVGFASVTARPAPAGDACGCQGEMSAMCVPLRSQDMAAVIAVLLAGWASVVGGGTNLGGLIASGMPGTRRRPRATVPVRVLVCVSRT